MTFAFSDFVNSKVSIYSSYYEDNTTLLGKLTEIEGDGEGFGNMIDIVGNKLSGTMLFAAQKQSATMGGTVHIFHGGWNRWTNVKIFLINYLASLTVVIDATATSSCCVSRQPFRIQCECGQSVCGDCGGGVSAMQPNRERWPDIRVLFGSGGPEYMEQRPSANCCSV
jgi:hypothetical protein